MATLKPPTIASVLAANSVGTSAASSTPSSSSSSPSTPAPVATPKTTTPTTTPTTPTSAPTVGSIGYYTNQGMTLQQAQEARRNASISIINPTVLKDPNSSLEEGSVGWYQSRGFDLNSAKNLAKDYQTKMGNTTHWAEDPSVVGAPQFAEQLGTTLASASQSGQKINVDDYINMYGISGTNKQTFTDTFSKRGGVNTASTTTEPNKVVTPTISQKVQVGKLVSDFKVGLGSAGGDRAKYYNNINYDSLSPNAKVVADRLFDSKKKDEENTTVSVPVPRTGLKTVTPSVPADSVAGIRAANPGMSIAAARAEAEKRRLAKVDTTTTTTTPTDFRTEYTDETKKVIDEIKAQNEKDKADQIAAAEANRKLAQEYNDSMITEHQNALTQFENDQNNLVSQYEGNRLNQVQGDLRRVLLERGVDVSKVTPEQLIALSGSVGVNAFNDISSAKEKAKASIETARQNALSKISQLKANNVLNQSQYNTAVADINSKSATANNNLDLKFAELKFGVASNKEAEAKTDTQNAVANILSTAQTLGVTGTQMGLVQQFIANAKTTPEALSRLLAELQNPSSPLYTTLKSNEAAATKKAQFDAALKQYEAETDRIKANASMTSANRPRSSGSTTTANPITGTNPNP